jgi:HlyD family secretion protein
MKIRVACISTLMLLTASCSGEDHQTYQGYVEGEPLLVGAKATGQVSRVAVEAGARLDEGALLFILDADMALARRDQAKARLEQARARLENQLKGKRPEEIAVIDAQIREAQARLAVAQEEYERQRKLLAAKVASQKAFDRAKADRDVAAAEVERLKREKRTAALPAREDEIEAARNEVSAAEAALDEARAAVRDRSIYAPRAGTVQDVFFREGEVVSEGRPVVSVLPPDNRKVLFFVPEPALAAVRTGQSVHVGCDGCGEGENARITFISDDAEFTPPVIYSVHTRDKLVYKVEAVPANGRSALKPGQPVDVSLR